VAFTNPSVKQQRNLSGLPAGPGPMPSTDTAAVKAAFNRAMRDNQARQADARAWMDAPLDRPAPSGDRGPSQPGHAGHVGAVLGVGRSPGEDLLPPASTNPRLPDPPAAPMPVTSSSSRPRLGPGYWLTQHQATQPSTPARLVYVTTDEPAPAKTLGLLGRLRRLFGGAK
jgi:hypothetical protein